MRATAVTFPSGRVLNPTRESLIIKVGEVFLHQARSLGMVSARGWEEALRAKAVVPVGAAAAGAGMLGFGGGGEGRCGCAWLHNRGMVCVGGVGAVRWVGGRSQADAERDERSRDMVWEGKSRTKGA